MASYDDHEYCVSCAGCSTFMTCATCETWAPSLWNRLAENSRRNELTKLRRKSASVSSTGRDSVVDDARVQPGHEDQGVIDHSPRRGVKSVVSVISTVEVDRDDGEMTVPHREVSRGLVQKPKKTVSQARRLNRSPQWGSSRLVKIRRQMVAVALVQSIIYYRAWRRLAPDGWK